MIEQRGNGSDLVVRFRPSKLVGNTLWEKETMGLPASRLRKHLLLIVSLAVLTVAGGCKQGPWTLWNSYAARFIDGQGRVIDPQGGARTTSEGQAYAMFFALADNDRASFDRLLNWTQANLASGDLQTHLPAWLWGKNANGEWKTLDPNPASDADVWMAYSLLEAGRLWNQPSYTNLGRRMMAQIARSEVAELPGFGPMLLPGSVGFVHDRTAVVKTANDRVWTLNPSYLPLFIFERFAADDPSGPWGQIALGIPRLLRESACHGFAMDWVDYVPGDGFYPSVAHAAPPQPGKEPEVPLGSYDAIRVYLWAGMIERGKARGEVLDAIPAMSAYLLNHDAPPEKISDQGIPMEQDGPVGFSAAVLPYLRALPHFEKPGAKQTIRMSAQRDASSGLYGRDLTYYDQNLALFATGFLDGRFRFGAGGDLKVEWKRT
jgi:endoglucanase